MIDFWKALSGDAKFSIIAFFSVAALGLLSMGALGALLYYPVCFLFKNYPSFNSWTGDWVWPAMIGVGMAWSVGFAFGGIAIHYLSKIISSKVVLYVCYTIILWLWAAILWGIVLSQQKL
jgi:hypothetical protein